MATITKIVCDLCPSEATHKQQKIQVVFTTEQTEGRSCKPHLDMQILDLCEVCLEKIVRNHSIYAHGAQGNNSYEVRENKK